MVWQATGIVGGGAAACRPLAWLLSEEVSMAYRRKPKRVSPDTAC